MADELDDRLRDLARDAEPLVVLAGPQAARIRGERRRARRRAAAASVAAALALTVGGWQLLPRLDGTGTRAATPAGTATSVPDPPAGTLPARIEAALLPAASLPYGVKWQWSVVTPLKAAHFLPSCVVEPAAAPEAEADRTYTSQLTSALAQYRLLAFADTTTAVAQAGALLTRMRAACGISAPSSPDTPSSSDTPLRFSGASKSLPGVTAWVESQGRYVAVLLVTVQDDPQVQFEGTGIAKCIDTSLHRLTSGAPATETLATGSGGARTSDNC